MTNSSLPPENHDTSNEFKVKDLSTDRLTKKEFKIQLQGLLLIAVQDACDARNETPKQLMQDLLEGYLVREGFLPEWYLKR